MRNSKTTQIRVAQDRRTIARIPARIQCRFTHDGVSRDAVIIDLSLNGALLASKFLPPLGSLVTLNLKMPSSKNLLTLEGKVIRGQSSISDHGSLSKFGIQFNHQSLELINLLIGLTRKA